MKNILFKKCIALSLVFSLIIFNSPLSSLAYENSGGININDAYSVEMVDNDSFVVHDSNGSQKITVFENSTIRRVNIENLKTGEKEYIRLDKNSGTIYSSITNKTISNVIPYSETSYKYVYISYSEIRDVVGDTLSIGGLISYLLTKVPRAKVAAEIASSISSVMGGIAALIPKDTNHGLRFEVKIVKYYRTRMGIRKVWQTHKTITSVTKY